MVTRIFAYPTEFTTLPDYSAHVGQAVEVVRPLRRGDEYDYCGDGMYLVRASDAWEGHAFYSELRREG